MDIEANLGTVTRPAKKVRLERNRLNLDGVEEDDKHFFTLDNLER